MESSSDILATKMIITTGSGEYDACQSCCCKLTIEIVSPQGSCKTNVLENLGQIILGIKERPFHGSLKHILNMFLKSITKTNLESFPKNIF